MTLSNQHTGTKIIGISGGSGSGKTTLAHKIFLYFGPQNAATLGQDSYYYDQSQAKDITKVNFDHPEAIDFDLLHLHLQMLKENKQVEVPIYDFVSHSRTQRIELLNPHRLIVMDGTLLLSQEKIRKIMDYSVFLNVPEQVRFERRLKRDVIERGRTKESVHLQFHSQVKPMHDDFVQTSMVHADLVLDTDYSEGAVLEQITRELKLPQDLIDMAGQI